MRMAVSAAPSITARGSPVVPSARTTKACIKGRPFCRFSSNSVMNFSENSRCAAEWHVMIRAAPCSPAASMRWRGGMFT